VPVLELGFGSALGSGKQYMPWIHVEGLCMMYVETIENKKNDWTSPQCHD